MLLLKSGSCFPLSDGGLKIRKHFLERESKKGKKKKKILHPPRTTSCKTSTQQFQFIIIAVSPEIGRNFACCSITADSPWTPSTEPTKFPPRLGSPIFGESNTRYDSNGPIENPPRILSKPRSLLARRTISNTRSSSSSSRVLSSTEEESEKICGGREETRGSRSILNGPTTSNTRK